MNVRLLLSSVAIVLLTGCISTPGGRFYTLPVNPAVTNTSKAAYSIAFGPVTLPELIDRPQLVTRAGANRVTILEQERWAAPLQREIPRMLAANLAGLLGVTQVSTHSQSVVNNPDYRISVDILRFDALSGDGVNLEALWAVHRRGGGEPLVGRSTPFEAANTADYSALVAAHGRALARLSEDLAAAVRSLDVAAR